MQAAVANLEGLDDGTGLVEQCPIQLNGSVLGFIGGRNFDGKLKQPCL